MRVMQAAARRLNTEMYSRGRRGAPAKGVGRDNRRESSNLSFSARTKALKNLYGISAFCFCSARKAVFVPQFIPQFDSSFEVVLSVLYCYSISAFYNPLDFLT